MPRPGCANHRRGSLHPIDPDRGDRPRVASWPHLYGPNPYLPTLHAALAGRGIAHVPDVPLEPRRFVGPGRAADFLHLHWLYPLFREGGSGRLRGARGVRDGLARIRAIQASGVPVIWTVHNVRPHDGFLRGERAGYEAVHRTADLRVFHSRSARDDAAALYGAAAGDSVVTYHGTYDGAFPAPRDRDAVRAEEGVAEGDRLLLCFGQIRAYKGFDLAVDAMARLRSEPYRLLVAGRPIDRSLAGIRRRARRLPSVTLDAGVVPADRVADLLHASDAVLLPYRSITGSGVLLHALTAGRAVVASDLPYFRELLGAEPRAAALFRPGSAADLAERIRRLFAVAAAEREDAAAALARRFAWSATVGPLAEWILARHGRG